MKFGLKYEMKTTSDEPLMEDDLKILRVVYLSNHSSDLPEISNLSLGDQTKLKIGLKSEMKTTFNGPPIGRRTQNIKSGISQQPLIGYSSNFKLKLRGPNQVEDI
jgi:hypothetical protein